MSENSINVSWSVPLKNGKTVTEYVVNITTLRRFDAPLTGLGYGLPEDNSNFSLGPSTVTSASSIEGTTGSSGGSRSTTVSADDAISAEDKVEVKMRQIKV